MNAPEGAAGMAGTLANLSGERVFFWIFFAATVLGALATVTRRNPVVAVVCLVGTFFSLAVEFLLLHAPFLAVLEVLVYAGAIMVLFVFVVMVVSRDETRPLLQVRGPIVKGLGVVSLGLIVYRLAAVFRTLPYGLPTPAKNFGTVSEVGRTLVTTYMFPFEAISLLLLVAVVGALVVAQNADAANASSEPADDASDAASVDDAHVLPEESQGQHS